MKNCLNCGHQIDNSNYCPNCGQKKTDYKLSTKNLLIEIMKEIIGVEKSFFSTFWLLLSKPGQATLNYNLGKRKSQFHPFKLFLIVLTVLLFTIKYFFLKTSNPVTDIFLNSYSYFAFIIIIPFFVICLELFNKKSYLSEHLVFTLHISTIICVLFFVISLNSLIDNPSGVKSAILIIINAVLSLLAFVYFLIYLFKSFRVVYDNGRLKSLFGVILFFGITFCIFCFSIIYREIIDRI